MSAPDGRARKQAGPTRSALAMVAAACAASWLAGCAHALKEPPPYAKVVGSGQVHSAGEVDALLAQGDEIFRRWDAASVREAERIWSSAAAADPGRTEGLIGMVRARLWLAEHEKDPQARQDAAALAVQAAQWCPKIAPRDPACSYWLGAALGIQARERPSTGLSALPKIEAAFKTAAEGSPALDEAGPERALALLYLRAPGWPVGPGDPTKALAHARRALELRPDHPPNHLIVGEALAASGDAEGSRRAYERAKELAGPRAEKGDREAAEWVEQADHALGKTTGEVR